MSAANPIVEYLSTLRTTVRRRLFAYGMFAVLSGGGVAMLTVMVLDWFLWLPPLLRLTGAIFFAAGFFLAMVHWVVRPLQARIGPNELAARLERRFSGFQDQLSSTVHFLHADTSVSPTMVRKVIADTEKLLKELPLDSALSVRPVAVRAGVFAAVLLVLVGLLALAPSWVRTGVTRYVDPWGATEWPRSVEIRSLTHDQTIALGESATVRMSIDRGLHPALRGVVHIQSRDGQSQVLALQRDADGSFVTTIDAITDELTYWFEAGDDDTRKAPSVIRAEKRPEIIEALASIEPPPYAASQTAKVVDLAASAVTAPMGGFVTVALRVSKPIVLGTEDAPVALRAESGEVLPLTPDPTDARRLSARFEVTTDLVLRPELRDELGFTNRGATSYAIRAVPDVPPSVTVLEPPALVEATPLGSLRLSARVEDDFGLERVELVAQGFRDGGEQQIPLAEKLILGRQTDGVEGIVNYVWSFEPLGVAPGDVISCEVIAIDNRIDADGRGQEGKSSPFRVKFISQAEFEMRLREDLTSLEARLRQLILDESTLHDRTSTLVQSGDEPTALTSVERETASAVSSAQARTAQQARDIAAKLADWVGRMTLNLAGTQEDRARLEAAGGELRRIASELLTDAAVRLGRAHESTAATSQQLELQTAAAAQMQAIERLNVVLRGMSSWGAFQGLVARSKDLLDRQNTIRAQTAGLTHASLGKPVESLTPEEVAALKRVERQQDQLAGDIERHMANLDQVAQTTRERDPAGAGAIEDALRAARANEVQKHADAAVEAIQGNRTAAAALEQRAAAEAIRKMIAALRERDERELAELRKRLEDAEELVADLMKQQQDIKTATHEADAVGADQPVFADLSTQQRTLARNTRMLSEDISQIERAVSASRHVRLAVDPMSQAEVELSASKPVVAEPAQDRAIGHLQDALDDLQALVQEDAAAAFRRTLTQIQEELQAILDAQKPVTEGVAKLRGSIGPEGRMGRTETREAAKLSREQTDAHRLLTESLPAFAKAPVYDWALQRVAKWMQQVRTSLDERRVDEELVSTSARVVRELEKLIGALDETQRMPGITEFAEAESDSGGAGGDDASESSAVALPTVAELLVLKAMQLDINDRTGRFNADFDPSAATEAELRQLTILGDDQNDVKQLTERVVAKAKGGR